MKIAYFIKKTALRSDASVAALLGKLSDGGIEVYDILSGGLQPGTGLLLGFGGDGTFLSAARLVAEAGVPIMGVNLGRLGFLSDAKLDEVASPLLSGDWKVEHRTMLQISVQGAEVSGLWPYALNEVSFCRTGAGILETCVKLDGQELPPYWSDGLLVSTSSGSTAYSLAVGGPICTPDVKALIVAPIAPHNLNVRPLVVPENAVLEVSLASNDSMFASMCLDNRDCPLPIDATVRITAAPFKLGRAVPGRPNFIGALQSKLFWGEDVRNSK